MPSNRDIAFLWVGVTVGALAMLGARQLDEYYNRKRFADNLKHALVEVGTEREAYEKAARQ